MSDHKNNSFSQWLDGKDATLALYNEWLALGNVVSPVPVDGVGVKAIYQGGEIIWRAPEWNEQSRRRVALTSYNLLPEAAAAAPTNNHNVHK